MTNHDKIRVLIVEDSKDDLYFIRNSLGDKFEITDSADGAEAYESIFQAPDNIDVVLLDYRLPSMDGLEILEGLKNIENAPGVIAMTVDNTVERAVELMKAGALDFHPKIKGFDDLPEMIGKVFEIVQNRREAKSLHKKVSESEEKHRLLLEHSGAGIGYYGTDGTIQFMNRMALQQIKKTIDQVFGKNIVELFGEENGRKYLERIQKTAKDGKTYEHEDCVSLPDDRYCFHSVYSPVKDDSGSIIGVQIIAHDITKSVKAEAELRRTQTNYQAILQNTDAHIALRDSEGRIIEYNEPFGKMIKKIFGVENLYGIKIQDLMPEDMKNEWNKKSEWILKGNIFREVLTHTFDDGEIKYFDLSFTPIFDKDRVIGFTEYTVDITAQKIAEQNLVDSEEKFRSIFQRANIGIGLVKDHKMYMVNPALEKISGFTEKELIGTNFLESVHPDDKDRLLNYYRKRTEGKRVPASYEAKFLKKDGSAFTADVKGGMINFSGEKVNMVMINDISERKEYEIRLENMTELLNDTQKIGKIGGWEFNIEKNTGIWTDEVYEIYGLNKDNDLISIEESIQFFSSEDRKIIADAFKSAIKKGKPYELELQFKDANGKSKWVRTSGRPVKKNGKIEKVYGYIQDITDRRLNQIDNIMKSSAIDSSEIGIGFADLKGFVTQVNDSLVKMWGYEKSDELIGKHSKDFWVKGQDLKQVEKALFRTRKGTWLGDLIAVKKDGTPFTVRLSVSLVKDEKGRPVCLSGSYIDISDKIEAQANLEKSEEKYRNLVENINDVVFSLDAAGKVTYISPAVSRVSAVKPEDIIGKKFAEFVHPDDQQYVRKQFGTVMSGNLSPGEFRVSDGKGGYIWIHSSSRVVMIDGKPAGLQGSFLDITDRKNAEDALKESEEWFRQLFEQMPSGVAVYEPVNAGKNFKFKNFNSTAEKIEKKDRKDIIGKKVTEVFPGVKDFGAFKVFQDVYKTGETQYFPEGYYKDQSDPGSWRETWVYKMPSGEIVAIYNDITARKNAENALIESEKKYRTLFENMVQGAFYQKADGSLIDCNPALLEQFGVTLDELKGRTSMHPEWKVIREDGTDLPGEEHPSMIALKTGKPVYDVMAGVYNPVRKKYVWLSINAIPQFRNGEKKPYQVFVTLHDFTDIKEAEKSLRESEEEYRLMLEKAGVFVSAYDRKGICLFMNDLVADQFGGKKEDFIGKSFPDLHGEMGEEYTKRIRKTIRTGKIYTYEDIVEFNESTRWLYSSVFPLQNIQGKIYAAQIVSQDITEMKLAEEALVKNEQFLNTIYNNSETGIYVVRVNGIGNYEYEGINNTYEKMYKIKNNRVVGISPRKLEPVFGKEAIDYTYAIYDECVREKTTHESEFELKIAGRYEWILSRIIPLFDETGNVYRLIGEAINITKRKKAEQELAESERKQSVLLGNLPGIAYRCKNNADWTMDFISEGCLELTGYPVSDFIDNRVRSYQDIIHPDDRERVWKEVQTMLKEDNHFELEYRIICKEDIIKYVWEKGVGVEKANNKVLYIEGFVTDITERKIAEETLKDTSERMQMVMKHANEGIWEWDLETNDIYFDEMALKMLGYEPGFPKKSGDWWFDRVHSEERSSVENDFNDYLSGKNSSYNTEFRLKGKDGTYIWIASTAKITEVDKNGNPLKVVGLHHDITARKKAEEQELRIRDLMREAEEVARVGGWEWDVVNDNWTFSDVWMDIHGVSHGEMTSEELLTVAHPDDRKTVRDAFVKMSNGENIDDFELRIIRKSDSRTRIIRSSGRAVLNESGQLVAVRGAAQDITERRKAENEIKTSEAFLNRIIDQSPFATWISDADGTLIRANPALKEFLNLTDEQLVGKYNVLNDPVIEKQGLIPLIRTVYEKGESIGFTCDWDGNDIPTLDLKGSNKVSIEATMFPVFDSEGAITNVVLNWVDITDRKLAREALVKSENRLSMILDATNDAIWDWNIETSEVYFSPRWLKMLGYKPDELPHSYDTWEMLLHPDDREWTTNIVRKHMNPDAGPFSMEFRMKMKSGEWKWLLGKGKLVEHDEKKKPLRMLGIHTDISERKKAEEELSKSELRLKRVLDNSPFPVALVDEKDNTILYWSKSARQLFGHDPKTSQEWYDLAYPDPDYKKEVIDRWRPIVDEIRGTDEVRNTGEYKIKCSDGSVKTCEIYAQFIPDNLVVSINDTTERKLSEQKLRYQSTVYENLSEAVIGTDLEFRIISWNRAAENTYGYTFEEAKGKRVSELLKHRYPENENREEVLRLFRENGFWEGVTAQTTKDGREILIEAKVKLIRDDQDNPVSVIAFNNDVTEKRKAETELIKEKERAQNYLDIAEVMLIALNEQGIVSMINKKGCEILGYAEEDIVNKNWFDNFLPERVREQVRTVSKSIISGQIEPYKQYENEILNSRGEERTIAWDTVYLRDENGNITGHLSSGLDITEKRKAELDLQEREKWFNELYNTINLGIAVYGAEKNGEDFVLKHMNDAGLNYLNVKIDDIVSKSVKKVFPGVVDIGLFNMFNEVYKTGDSRQLPVSQYQDDRIQLWVDNYVFKLPSGDIVAMFNDITEQKKAIDEKRQLEEQLFQAQKMESIGRMAGGIAHDFNNILLTIMGQSELLYENMKKKGDPNIEGAELIIDSAERAAGLTKQLLAMSRGGHLDIKPLDTNKTIRATVKMLEVAFEKRIKVTMRLSRTCKKILADQHQVSQVLSNLLINAKDAMPDGGELIVRSRHASGIDELSGKVSGKILNEYVAISVEDSGTGIEESELENIFDPFFTTKGEGEGTGLGLAVVYGIMKNHNGHITVSSMPGSGSVFTSYFPVATGLSDDVKTIDTLERGSDTVLLIDDENFVLKVSGNMLKKLGYKVYSASSGKEGLQIYKEMQKEIDLVLLDLLMPEMSGKEVFYAMKKINPDVRILLISGFSREIKAGDLLRDGAVGFIQKPFKLAELSRTVVRAINVKENGDRHD